MMNNAQTNAAFPKYSDTASSSAYIVKSISPTRILITENAYAWSQPVKKQLEELIRLPIGWDGYQGISVSFENANFALRILENISGLENRAPQVVPGTTGDLQIEWHTLKGDIELHVRAPNNVHAWRDIAGSNADGEEIALTNDFTVVARWIKEI